MRGLQCLIQETIAKKEYYTIDHLKDIKAQYYLIYGMRSNGKSYAVKHECLDRFMESGSKFIYLRRWDTEAKKSASQQYFEDLNLKKYVGDDAHVEVVSGKIYVVSKKENIRWHIGYSRSLNTHAHDTGASFPDVNDIIFEEFFARGEYLQNEPSILMDFVSTVARDRNIRVWCIGNTITRFCPYFTEWQIRESLNLKPGESQMYHFDTARYDEEGNKITTDIYVEHARQVASKSKMFFGKKADMITKGEWDTEAKPKIPDIRENYECIYSFVLSAKGFMFLCECLYDEKNGTYFIYVTRKTTPIRDNTRVVCDYFSTDRLYTKGLNPLSDGERKIFSLIKDGKICYGNNLTGTEFEQAYREIRRL